jgi:hypothetical protein
MDSINLLSQKRQKIFETLTRRARRMAKRKPARMLVCEAETLRLHQAHLRSDVKAKPLKPMRNVQANLVPDMRDLVIDHYRDSWLDEQERPRKKTVFVNTKPGSLNPSLQTLANWPTQETLVPCGSRQNSAPESSAKYITSIPSLAELLNYYQRNLQHAAASVPPTAASLFPPPPPGIGDIATLLLLARIAAPMSSDRIETAAITAAIAAAAGAAIWTNLSALPVAGRPEVWRAVPAAFTALPPHAATTSTPMRWWAAAPGLDAAAAAAAVAQLEAIGPARP